MGFGTITLYDEYDIVGSEDGTARLWDLRGSLQTDLEMDFETGSSRAASSRKSGAPLSVSVFGVFLLLWFCHVLSFVGSN